MLKICARLYFFPQCAIYAQDRTYSPCAIYVQYMRKICAKLYFFPQCAIYAQDLHKIVLLFPIGNICARLYFSPQCATPSHHLRTKHHHSEGHTISIFVFKLTGQTTYNCILRRMRKLRIGYERKFDVQYLHKIFASLDFLLSMCNICARFAKDCTSFPNAQYMHKIVLLSPMHNICTRFANDCTYSPMPNIYARFYFFPQCAIYVQDLQKIVFLSPMGNKCARLYFSSQCAGPSHHLCTKHHRSAGNKIFYFLIQIDRSNYIK